jgi:hypothetical protein
MNGSWHCEVTLLDGGPCGSSGDAAADGPLAALCTGTFSRMAVNGIDSNPSVQGAMLPYQCCYAAELVAVTQTVPITMVPIVVTWSVQVGSATPIPATIDLANPPAGWTVAVDVGCDPAQAGCYPAPDSYTTGFTGTLQIERTSSGGFDTSLCLSVAEPAGSPHPLVHSLELYAPHVPSG